MPERVQARLRMRPRLRVVLLWSVVGLLLLAALGSAVGALQRSVYSPAGLVGAYLTALSQHDAQAALALPGVAETPARLAARRLPAHPSTELLRGDVLTRLTDVRIVGQWNLGDDRSRVQAAYRLDGRPHRSTFTVAKTGSVLAVFDTWRFAPSPLAVAHIIVLHAASFTIGPETVDTRATVPSGSAFSTGAADYLVFAPSALRLGHESPLLTARPVRTVVTTPGSVTGVTVATEASATFASKVQHELDRFLRQCVTQRVLNPAGCPMGVQIDDRVLGLPSWRMVRYPHVTIVGGATTWSMPRTDAVAHLTVRVQSLFDGSVSTRDEDLPFTVSLPRIAVRPDGSIGITVGD